MLWLSRGIHGRFRGQSAAAATEEGFTEQPRKCWVKRQEHEKERREDSPQVLLRKEQPPNEP